jgi:surface antigen
VDHNPTPGSIAHWPASGAMKVGHVGVVKAVNRDGSIDIEQYNLREDGRYSVLHLPRNASALDRSNGRPWTVPWTADSSTFTVADRAPWNRGISAP